MPLGCLCAGSTAALTLTLTLTPTRYAGGDVYTGELLGLARRGAGECKYGGGASVYEGQWAADRHEGQVSYPYPYPYP